MGTQMSRVEPHTGTGSARGSTATVNAGSDFPCLRLLVLAAESLQEQPDWGRLENNPLLWV